MIIVCKERTKKLLLLFISPSSPLSVNIHNQLIIYIFSYIYQNFPTNSFKSFIYFMI